MIRTVYLRQLRMFHRIVRFKSLGVAFEDAEDGPIYSALQDVEQVSKERGFQVVTGKVTPPSFGNRVTDRSCMECYRRLSGQADAVYLTALNCTDRITGRIAAIFKKAHIPSFAMVNSNQVKQGILLSISSDSGYKELVRYNAGKLAAILHGAKPGSLEQVFADPLHIAVNLKTARQIGFKIPKGILRVAAEIYDE